MHGFEKIRLRQNYVGFILILYFDEDLRSCFMIVVGFWKILGVYFYIQVILYFGLDHRAVVMLPYFH